ncbi:MAG TPA: RdgB/HAM1 family non-canonical purine NTP pyrophosphatase [Gammaproteobacteria bacterium]|nr:RdgB/HAM1 family non-canonical purine NTP pyrophosphatase [Gammaproteobacteria bacterium]
MTDSRIVVLASNNKGKLREFAAMFEPLHIDIRPQADYGIPEAEETGLTFVENSILKARNACEHSGLPAMADDSGIEVDALQGAPGIYSARYAGPECDDQANNDKLVAALRDIPAEERTARYRACLVYMRHAGDPAPLIAEGEWEGVIVDEPRGQNGFGYDPYFFLPDRGITSAELDPDEKNRISHRAIALEILLQKIRERTAS